MKQYSSTFWGKTKRLFEPVKYNKKVTLYLILYFVAQYSIGIVFIFFIRDGVNALEFGNIDILYRTLYIYLGIFIFLFLLIFLLYKGWTYSYNRYRSFAENKYLKKFVLFDNNSLELVGTGKTIAIISKGVKMWGTIIDRILIECIFLFLSVGVTFYFISEVSFILAIIFLFFLIFGIILGIYLNNKVMTHRNKRNELDNLWSRRMVKIIMSKTEILQSGKIGNEISKLHRNHEGQIGYNHKMAIYLVPFFVVGSFIVAVLLFFTFYYFGNLYFRGEITLGYIASLTGAFIMMNTVFLNALDYLKNFGKDFTEVRNLWNFFDTTPTIQGYEEGDIFKYKTGDIVLQNIDYSYTDTSEVFKSFTAKIIGGKITALVGPSGGGKSTLVKLIAGYIRPDSGEILVDGQKLSETSLKSYYKNVGYLTQDPSVFDGTIRENLTYVLTKEDTDTTDFEEILTTIIKQANCEFIYDLPNGLETEIGERGVKLSGGQKQRLAIAKIFLKDPKIIILDEPTSALDSISEKKITEAMHNLFKERTVLIIAHRLQTVKYADDILVIQNGEILERGTHKELVKHKGFYKEMLDLQSGF